MATKIFLTGATGYIGGDALYALYKAHPEYEYTLLVRTEESGKPVAEAYPKAKLVYGTLDDSEVIEKAASEADIVVHTADASDNIPAAKAISRGLAKGHDSNKPGYWIHICGTGILQWYDETEKRYGQGPLPEQKYDDLKDIEKIITLPDQAYHRDVDKLVLAANDAGGIKTCIVGPPTIYGPGRGPVNQRSKQVYHMTKFLMQNGYAPVVPPGLTEWDNVHVDDLSDLLVTLVEAAQDPKHKDDPEIFGPHGYFFAENGVHKWSDVAQWVADEAVKQGYMAEAKIEYIPYEKVENSSWGTNSKSVAARARKIFGWNPKGKSLKDSIPEIVEGEAKILKIEPQRKV